MNFLLFCIGAAISFFIGVFAFCNIIGSIALSQLYKRLARDQRLYRMFFKGIFPEIYEGLTNERDILLAETMNPKITTFLMRLAIDAKKKRFTIFIWTIILIVITALIYTFAPFSLACGYYIFLVVAFISAHSRKADLIKERISQYV